MVKTEKNLKSKDQLQRVYEGVCWGDVLEEKRGAHIEYQNQQRHSCT